ncbi:MAG: glycerophosphodiester phosphodiesterase [Tepidiformaceae bacterium]
MPNLLVIGHAGAGGEAPENTLAGVRASLAAAAEAMEIDVQLCADGVPVLMHDETLDRTTSLSGTVREASLAALRAASAGPSQNVPTLDEVLDLVAGQLTVMCELKATPNEPACDERLVNATLAVIERHSAHTWTAIHSFKPGIVAHSRATEARISAAIISLPVDGDRLERLLSATVKRNAQAVSIHHACIDRALVVRARQRQISVWAWTADTPADWARLATAGVDGIITNVPARMRAWLNANP